MARVALLLCRYSFDAERGALSAQEQIALLTRLRDAPPVAYRKAEPTADDFDTYLMRPEMQELAGRNAIVLDVVRDVRFRQVTKANRATQTVTATFEPTEEAELARVVMVPSLGALAVHDAVGEGRITGPSAIRRLQAIVATLNDTTLNVTVAGTAQDLQKAIGTWELDQFSFQARPFNPHPSNPGELLSDLLARDDVGELRGVAVPKEGGHIHPADAGLVKETIGLADKGYATYGVRGRTESGAEAVVKKQPFSHDRQKNLDRQKGPQQLRVYIEGDNQDDLDTKAARVLLEFFRATEAEHETQGPI